MNSYLVNNKNTRVVRALGIIICLITQTTGQIIMVKHETVIVMTSNCCDNCTGLKRK